MRPTTAVLIVLFASTLAGAACGKSNGSPANSLSAPTSLGNPGNNLVSCEKTADDASILTRTLYWSSFPGTSISEVDLYLTSKDTSGNYVVKLDIIVNGATAVSVTGGVVLTRDVDSFFAFVPTAVNVPQGASVRFAVSKVDGPGDLSYGGQTAASCAVVTTSDGSSTTQIVGPKIPIRVLGQ